MDKNKIPSKQAVKKPSNASNAPKRISAQNVSSAINQATKTLNSSIIKVTGAKTGPKIIKAPVQKLPSPHKKSSQISTGSKTSGNKPAVKKRESLVSRQSNASKGGGIKIIKNTGAKPKTTPSVTNKTSNASKTIATKKASNVSNASKNIQKRPEILIKTTMPKHTSETNSIQKAVNDDIKKNLNIPTKTSEVSKVIIKPKSSPAINTVTSKTKSVASTKQSVSSTKKSEGIIALKKSDTQNISASKKSSDKLLIKKPHQPSLKTIKETVVDIHDKTQSTIKKMGTKIKKSTKQKVDEGFQINMKESRDQRKKRLLEIIEKRKLEIRAAKLRAKDTEKEISSIQINPPKKSKTKAH